MKPTPSQGWTSADPYRQPVQTHIIEKRMGFWPGLIIGGFVCAIPAFFIGGCFGAAGSGLEESEWKAEQRQHIRDEIYRDVHMKLQREERSQKFQQNLKNSLTFPTIGN